MYSHNNVIILKLINKPQSDGFVTTINNLTYKYNDAINILNKLDPISINHLPLVYSKSLLKSKLYIQHDDIRIGYFKKFNQFNNSIEFNILDKYINIDLSKYKVGFIFNAIENDSRYYDILSIIGFQLMNDDYSVPELF